MSPGRTVNMSPQRRAGLSPVVVRNLLITVWVTVAAAFALFLTVVFGGPLLIWTSAQTATVSPRASVRVRAGDVRLSRLGESLSFGDGGEAPAGEGTSITPLGTGGSSAFVRFFDGSTAMLEQHGTLTLETMRRTRFSLGDASRAISMRLDPAPEGTTILRIGTTHDEYSGLGPSEMRLETPQATLLLGGGSHVTLRVDAEVLRVLVNEGQATVTATAPSVGDGESGQDRVIVSRGERTEVRLGRLPLPATDDPIELLVNGDFASTPGDLEAWQLVPSVEGDSVNRPNVERVVDDEGRASLRLERTGAEGSPSDIVLRHTFGAGFDLGEVRELELAATLRIDAQSLPGGGDRGVEFPLILILGFEDDGGDEHTWQVGFYAVPPDPEGGAFPGATVDTSRDIEVPLGEWAEYRSGNLLDPTTPLALINIARGARPASLERVEVKASGHDFDSRVDSISLRWK